MRIPTKIADLINLKTQYIDKATLSLEKSFVKAQEKLLDDLLSDVIPKLKVEDGNILDTEENYRLLQSVDTVFRQFDKYLAEAWLKAMNTTTKNMANLTHDYLSVVLAGELPKKFEQVLKSTEDLTNFRFGLDNGKFVRGGFLLDNIFMYGQEDFKRQLSHAVSSQMNLKDFIRLTKQIIAGDEKANGSLEKKYQAFAYDIYQQWDRTYQTKIMDEFEMRYFIYSGGLIDTSRDFCVAHNDKVWSVTEAQDWVNWTPSKGIKNGEFPEGYKIDQKDIYSHPSYMDYEGYDPLIDFGGYRCRHYKSPISENLARRLRPNIK